MCWLVVANAPLAYAGMALAVTGAMVALYAVGAAKNMGK